MVNRMGESAWEFQHLIECSATRQFAWAYWTNISNWDDPPAKFKLEGRFENGSRLTTILPDQSFASVIRNLKPEREITIEMQLEDAILAFQWEFEELPKGRVQITQRLRLAGPNATAFVAQASLMERSVPDGMRKLASAIERTVAGAGG